MAAIELWTSGAGMPSAFAQRARRAEADGWDGITIVAKGIGHHRVFQI
jgi:hypothetical protein